MCLNLTFWRVIFHKERIMYYYNLSVVLIEIFLEDYCFKYLGLYDLVFFTDGIDEKLVWMTV